MGNQIQFNSAASVAIDMDYSLWRNNSLVVESFLSCTGTTITLAGEARIRVGTSDIAIIEDDVTLGPADLDTGVSFDVSSTYYVYACKNTSVLAPFVYKISLNASYPSGWTAANSRKIGGFDTDGSGNADSASAWDLRTNEIAEILG